MKKSIPKLKRTKISITPDIVLKFLPSGAIVQFIEDDYVATEVYKFDDEDLTDLQTMLYDIVNIYYPGSKYDKHRINITIQHGSSYACNDSDCKICKKEI